MEIAILTAAVQIDLNRTWLHLSGIKIQDTSVTEICVCNTQNFSKIFSCMDKKKKKKPKVCTCDTKQKELARYRHILEMKTLRNIIYKRCPSLEVSGGLDGLVVHSDQKGEAAEHTE